MPDYGEVEAVKAATERAHSVAGRLRLPMPNNPGGECSFPDDLGAMSESELAKQLGYWASLTAYASTQVAIFDAAATIADTDYEQAYDARYRVLGDKAVTDKKSEAGGHPAVISAKQKAIRLKGDARLLESLRGGYEQKYLAVSRELTRRRSQAEAEAGR